MKPENQPTPPDRPWSTDPIHDEVAKMPEEKLQGVPPLAANQGVGEDDLGHDWSQAPAPGCIGFMPSCHRCNCSADSAQASMKCDDVMNAEAEKLRANYREYQKSKQPSPAPASASGTPRTDFCAMEARILLDQRTEVVPALLARTLETELLATAARLAEVEREKRVWYDAAHKVQEDFINQIAALETQLEEARARITQLIDVNHDLEHKAENASDELWLEAIAKHWNSYKSEPWDIQDSESREEGIEANVIGLFNEIDSLAAQLAAAQRGREEAERKREEQNRIIVELRNEENGKRHFRWMQDIQAVCPEAGCASVATVAIKAICHTHADLTARLRQTEAERDEARKELEQAYAEQCGAHKENAILYKELEEARATVVRLQQRIDEQGTQV